MTQETTSGVLTRDAIFLARSGDDQEKAIEFVGGQLVDRGVVGVGYIEGMKQRETNVSTYLGNGVALPHGTFETKGEVKGTALVVAQYPDGVLWGDETAHLVIGLAAVGEDHVHVLSALAEVLQDEELCERLWVTDDADLIYDTLTTMVDEDEDDEDEEEESASEMTVDVEVTNPAGLHARPASLLVDAAKGLDSDITVMKGSKSANAKSIMSVLALGAVTGDTVTVTASGPDAKDAIAQVTEILQSQED